MNPKTGKPVEFYEVNIEAFETQIFDGLPATQMVGYDGMSPGPTFRIAQGTETVVRFVNQYDRNSSIHLHGSFSRAPFDGWAADTIEPNQYKDYYYPNSQRARTLWYHDHAEGITAVNAYSGQAGFYILEDGEDRRLGLPTGRYDIPLMLASKTYTADGQHSDIGSDTTSTYGDTYSVNGIPSPYLEVEPRKYRFRLLNAAASRTFNLTLADTNSTNIPLTVVGADGGLSSRKVDTKSLILAMAERWEVVIDFAGFRGQNLTLQSQTSTPRYVDIDYWNGAPAPVMQFRVKNVRPTSNDGNGPVPTQLSTTIERAVAHDTVDQAFFFNRVTIDGVTNWAIDGRTFTDPRNRIVRNVPRGTTERWSFRSGGGWSHPIHVHLVDFEIVSRVNGRDAVMEYEEYAVKDVVSVAAGETVNVMAKYAPWDGVYMFHCHNLVHEDHDMMAAFNVTALPDFGYTEVNHFYDPMDAEYRAVPFTAAATRPQATAVLKKFAGLEAYEHAEEVDEALDEYHATRTASLGGGYVTAIPRRARRNL